MSDQYYRFFPGDYLRDTQGLTLTENGAYRMLLDAYYSQEFLPDDSQELYMICRAFKEFEQRAVDKVVNKYFSRNGNGHLINNRAELEITHRKEFIAEQSRKGKISAEKRWRKDNHGSTTVTVRLQPDFNLPSPSPSPSPLPIPSPEKKKLFVDTSDEVRLSERLFDLILKNNPQAKKPNIQVWAKQIDLMLRQDSRIWQDIESVIEWCQEDNFWKLNILSTKKLREKFDQLYLKMTQGPKKEKDWRDF